MQVIMNRPTRTDTAYPGLLEQGNSHLKAGFLDKQKMTHTENDRRRWVEGLLDDFFCNTTDSEVSQQW